MFFLALSCFQGRPMASSLRALLALRPDGVQLTPGNQPTRGFAELVSGLRVRTHHGFHFEQWKQRVWNDDGTCAVRSESVHPPTRTAQPSWSPTVGLPVLETMYPGNALGTGDELEQAMELRLPLAVDVSHVFMQFHAGVIGDATWKRLQDYEQIAEVHVSRNDGRSDQHAPLTASTFGLEWAREKLKAGTPVILESYFHRASDDSQRAQCALFDGVRS
ncbi:MAG: hypothetical protein QM817_19765 [Archangium sp.]